MANVNRRNKNPSTHEDLGVNLQTDFVNPSTKLFGPLLTLKFPSADPDTNLYLSTGLLPVGIS